MRSIGAELGKEIRRIRTAKKMSQEELAFKAGISAAHLGQIERATKNPTVDTVSSIASALGVTLPELFSFNTAVEKEEHTLLDKITAKASTLSEEHQREVLRMMRIFRRVQRGTPV